MGKKYKVEIVQRFMELETLTTLSDGSTLNNSKLEMIKKNSISLIDQVTSYYGAVGKHNLGSASGFMFFKILYHCATSEQIARYVNLMDALPVEFRDINFRGIRYQLCYKIGKESP